MKIWIALVLLIFSVSGVTARDVEFYSINSLYGLSFRDTGSVCQDDNGFIWASSKTGILRLTPGGYRLYALPLVSTDVFSVKLVYHNSVLCAFTNNGQVFVYNEVYDRFDLVTDLRSTLGMDFVVLTDMVIDGTIESFFMASSAGLYHYHCGEVSLCGEQGDVPGLTPYKDNKLFCIDRKGIYILDRNSRERKQVFALIPRYDISVSKSWYDPKTGLLWIGTVSDGLYIWDVDNGQFSKTAIEGFPEQPVLAFERNSDATVLVGIDGQGIWEVSDDGKKALNVYKEDIDDPYSLNGDGVYDICRDNNGTVWVATYSGGLSFFSQELPVVKQVAHKINNPNSLGNNHVNQVIEDSRGNLWFATNNGISFWDVSCDRWKVFYQDKHEQAKVFLTLCEDNDGNIWAGTYSSGVYLLDGRTGRQLRHYIHDESGEGLSGRFVFDILLDSEGDVWIGGIHSEIICYRSAGKTFRTYSGQPVRTFAEFLPGKIYAACSYGLLSIDKESGQEEILLNNYLGQDLLVVDGYIWLATGGDGLICYDPRSRDSRKFTTEDGLVSNFVNSITNAGGFFWLGTENGLCRFDPRTFSVVSYPGYSPLTNISFNVNAATRLADGRLILGTNAGAVVFDPEKMHDTPAAGRIYLNDLLVSGRSIRERAEMIPDRPVDKLEELPLQYFQNNVSLELLPLGVSSGGFKFSWKLDGLDPDWNKPTDLRTITYTNLPSGDYLLHIKMFDNSLSQVVDERSLSIIVTPPFWGALWFRFLTAGLLIGIFGFFLKTYINRMRRRYAEDKIRFFTNTAHDIRTSLTLISAPVEELTKDRELSEKSKYYVDLVAEQSGRLSSVATQLLDFQKVDAGKGQLFPVMTDIIGDINGRLSIFGSVAGKKNIKIVFSSDQESYVTAVDILKIEKVIDNLISNAIKYSHSGSRVEVIFSADSKKWTLEVRDYGLGISEKARKRLFREFYRGDNSVNSKMVGSGIGLLLVKNYVNMHKGKVSVASKVNSGSAFRITIPYMYIDVEESAISPAPATSTVPPTGGDIYPALDKGPVSGKMPHVLIAEDNLELQRFLLHSFQEHYRVTVTDNGTDAWEMIRTKLPDMVVSDVMMPGMDGFELCKCVKSTFETSHIPFILLTTLSEKTQQLQGLGLGADDYITKPFDMSLLMQRIRTMVGNRERVRERAVRLPGESDDQPLLENKHNDQFVKKAIEVVNRNIENPAFGKDEFASAMNVSGSLLYKKIKALTGQAPVDLIKTIRLNNSLELLRTGQYTITEISELCGFSSVGYFSTVFKKHFGVPPAKWGEQGH